jgi:hypothetical protein
MMCAVSVLESTLLAPDPEGAEPLDPEAVPPAVRNSLSTAYADTGEVALPDAELFEAPDAP